MIVAYGEEHVSYVHLTWPRCYETILSNCLFNFLRSRKEKEAVGPTWFLRAGESVNQPNLAGRKPLIVTVLLLL
jgi:hypothetical protein